MKVQATFTHTFAVTREVDIDAEDFERWAHGRYQGDYARDLAIAVYLDEQDEEFLSEVFRDWRTNEPLPSDFELQYTEVSDVDPLSPESQTGDDDA